jgi:SRSO17 transposase
MVLERLQRFILAHLGDPEAILVLDETAELKKGTMSVGVGRQHAGSPARSRTARRWCSARM